MDAAVALWGARAVDLARTDPAPGHITPGLLDDILARAKRPGVFRSWALGQPWPVFCAVVRLVAGDTRSELEETMAEESNKTIAITVRVTPEQARLLDAYRQDLGKQFPGASISRSAIIRMLTMQGLDGLKGKGGA